MTGNFVKAHTMRYDYHKATLVVRRVEREMDYAKVDGELEKLSILEEELVKAHEVVGEIEAEMARLPW